MWRYSKIHNCNCKIIEEKTLWGQTVYRIWLVDKDEVIQVPASDLTVVDVGNASSTKNYDSPNSRIASLAAAGRVFDAIETCGSSMDDGVLLAPLESAVTPLPHQLKVLERVINANPSRFLLADEVGLGKTIEAGLILREMKLRGLVERVLVVSPTGLINQWISEMKVHFNEKFHLFIPRELEEFSRYFQATKDQLVMDDEFDESSEFNPWTLSNNVICPMDAIKPISKRKGWTAKDVEKYNAERFFNVINAGWDLIIIDEAHRVAGTDPSVARFKLGWGLGQAAPHILLLSATPHQGKGDAFHRLFTILDQDAFPEESDVTHKNIRPYFIRNEKRSVVDGNGKLIFKPRKTRTITVEWEERHSLQRQLYEEVTEYVREGYDRLSRLRGTKRIAIGFLLVLIQRLVTSSTRAVVRTLERRLALLSENGGDEEENRERSSSIADIEWEDMDGDMQIETVVNDSSCIDEIEAKEIEGLLHLAKKVEMQGMDVKAEKLFELIYDLQADENAPSLKILIFTEFTETQRMLGEFLGSRGFTTVIINGSMTLDERNVSQNEFAQDVQILISTEAGGEGLNLQFCHVVINYDMPWNPMRIEQRIGRIDRIGQKKEVLAINMMISDTVECRVREVIETKLAIICSELGINKIGDILDSADIGKMFEGIYVESIKKEDVSRMDSTFNELQSKLKTVCEYEKLYLPVEQVADGGVSDYIRHPFPFWVEQMVIGHICNMGGKAEKRLDGWTLTWPDGVKYQAVVFTADESERFPYAKFLSIGDKKVQAALDDLNRHSYNLQIDFLRINGLPETVVGIWSLWRFRISTARKIKTRILPLFVHDNGKVFPSTAKAVWDALITNEFSVEKSTQDTNIIDRLFPIAEKTFEGIYHEMMELCSSEHKAACDKKEHMFESKQRAINKIGIENIRESKLKKLIAEKESWRKKMDSTQHLLPELQLISAYQINTKGL